MKNYHSNNDRYTAEKRKAWQDYQELSKDTKGILKKLHAEVYIEELHKIKKRYNK